MPLAALAGAEQGDQRGGGGGVLDDAREGLRQPDHLPQPVHDRLLELGGDRARLPAHALDAEPGADEIAEHRRQAGVRREVGEEARVVPVGDAGQDDLVEVAEQRGEPVAGLGRRRRQRPPHVPGGERAHHRPRLDPGAVAGDPVDEGVAEPDELVVAHGGR
jgi:hypothetical protein